MRRVRFTTTARGHVDAERSWWLENRDHREIFATEIEKALEVLAILPGVGTPYAGAGVPGIRRVYLRRIACHLYYVFDDEQVVIMALWGARRGRGPALR